MQSEPVLPLHNNESYWLLTDEMFGRYNTLRARQAATYPEYDSLKAAFAASAGVPKEEIVLTAGSDAAIERIIEMCAIKGLRPLIPLPTFSAYELLCKKYALDFRTTYYKEAGDTFEFPLEETLNLIQAGDVDVVFLCQPNNPLASKMPHPDYLRILDAAHEASVLVVVDEAYAEYAPEHDAQYVAGREMILLRTLSKSYGLAGLRVGFAIANPQRVAELSSRLLPWPVAHTSVALALSALADAKTFAARRNILIHQRDAFIEALRERLDATVFDSLTNFVLLRIKNASRIREALSQEGILIAEGASKTLDDKARALLSDTLRISVPAPEDMERVISALERASGTRQS